MKNGFLAAMLLTLGGLALGARAGAALQQAPSPAPEWSPSLVKSCDRACLVGFMDGYMNANFKHDPSAVPTLARDVRMTENTAEMNIGGQDSLVAIRLKIDRNQIEEIEQIWTRGVDKTAIPLLTTPRPGLVDDVPASEKTSRDVLIWAANSYFDALEGDDGKIGAFADDCVRHENGYQTVNNPAPGGRMMPSPILPNPNTPQGKEQLKISMMSCSAQISTKILNFIKKIRPRRVLVVDEQKGVVATFPFFVEDGTRRGGDPNAPPGMMLNLYTMETF